MVTGATQAELIAELTQALSAVSASDPNWGEAALHYNTSLVTKVVENLVGDSVAITDKDFAVNEMLTQMTAGQTFGAVVEWAMTVLDNVDHADPVWGNAATLLDNRIAVSKYYSIDKAGAATDLTILKNILAGVTTDVASVVAAKAAIDTFIIDLSSLDGNNGFRLDGAGEPVSSAGDVNGDGFDDLIVGTNDLAPNGDPNSVSSYLVFGKATGFSVAINLSNLNGSNGFRLDEGAKYDRSGYSVSGAGDVNGDSFDDLIIGAFNAAPNGYSSGSSYVVFGKAAGFSATINLSNLNGSNGFRLDGVASNNRSGYSVSGTGDVNGDGFDDLIIGTFTHNADNSRSSYVVFGGNFTNAVTFLGTSGDDSLVAGTSAAERFVAGNGNDTMTGDGGADVFHGGAGDDIIQVSDLSFQRVNGGTGNDILALAGSGLNLSLANVHGKISDIETIDLTGTGNNTLTLMPLDVLNLSDSSNTLESRWQC